MSWQSWMKCLSCRQADLNPEFVGTECPDCTDRRTEYTATGYCRAPIVREISEDLDSLLRVNHYMSEDGVPEGGRYTFPLYFEVTDEGRVLWDPVESEDREREEYYADDYDEDEEDPAYAARVSSEVLPELAEPILFEMVSNPNLPFREVLKGRFGIDRGFGEKDPPEAPRTRTRFNALFEELASDAQLPLEEPAEIPRPDYPATLTAEATARLEGFREYLQRGMTHALRSNETTGAHDNPYHERYLNLRERLDRLRPSQGAVQETEFNSEDLPRYGNATTPIRGPELRRVGSDFLLVDDREEGPSE